MLKPIRAMVKFLKWVFLSALLWIVVISVLVLILVQPTFKEYPSSRKTVSPYRMREHVYALAIDHTPRNYKQRMNLDASASYIADQFDKAGARISEQPFQVQGNTDTSIGSYNYRNVIASFGPDSGSRIIIGAHYDTYEVTPGADDNASGVAGLIELAYLLGQTELQQRVDLVAYTLEEPPFFATADMGSDHHARSLIRDGIDVEGMICLEMIGYFSDEPGSQSFPLPVLNRIYPDRANYIAVVGRIGDRKLVRHMKAVMRGATDLPVYSICAPKSISGIDLSDHRNYWAQNIPAVMVSDTSFYRNKNYHRTSDTPETLDYDRMAKVVLGVYEAVVQLANED